MKAAARIPAEVTGAQIAEVLTAVHQILIEQGIARGRSVRTIPGRPIRECPCCVDAAFNLAVGHGPYGFGCFTPCCPACTRADAARILLARRLPGPPAPDLDAAYASGVIQIWNDRAGLTDDEILAEVAAAAAAAAGEPAGGDA